MLRGIAASPGFAIAPAYHFKVLEPPVERCEIGADEIGAEIDRFKTGVEQAKHELRAIRDRLAREMGEDYARFLDAQLLVLEDEMAIKDTIERVQRERVNAAYVFDEIVRRTAASIGALDDGYLRERAPDIKDVGRRVLRIMRGEPHGSIIPMDHEVILTAHDVNPSDTAQLRGKKVAGIVTEVGGRTSHMAIMARALEIPAVVGVREAGKKIADGDMVIVDGNKGVVIVNPDDEELERYRSKRQQYVLFTHDLEQLRDSPAVTVDGHEVQLSANIELSEEVPSAIEHGCRGIGLFRTEFLFLTSLRLPDEEEQFHIYDEVAELIAPETVIIRTLDIGGDKVMHDVGTGEMNPYLGWRAIRFSLTCQDIFRSQLRAILRASTRKNVKVMYPFVATIEELRQINVIFREVQDDLKRDSIPFDEECESGLMIETPSAALTADAMARETDFFSIGSNDLTQYTLAVDRGNERVAHLFMHYHPAVLRLMERVVHAAHSNGISVGVCGEVAGDLLVVPVLLGLGLNELSTNPIDLPRVKRVVRSLSLREAKRMARTVLGISSGEGVRRFLAERFQSAYPDLAELLIDQETREVQPIR